MAGVRRLPVIGAGEMAGTRRLPDIPDGPCDGGEGVEARDRKRQRRRPTLMPGPGSTRDMDGRVLCLAREQW